MNEIKRKKLLYITDLEEYTDHGTIALVFNKYLKQYCDVNIVYFTKFKNSFQSKGDDYVVPQQYEKETCRYLDAKDVDLASYDFVFVRNILDILSDVLNNREKYGYKVGFRLPFPRTEEACEARKATQTNNFFDSIITYFERSKRNKLLSQCDLLMPTSQNMKDTFYSDIDVETFPLPAGLDPARITPHRISDGDERYFIYVGTLDSLRQFERVLVAFSKVKSKNWHLNLSTFNPEFARKVMGNYPTIADNVTVMHAENLNELMGQVDDCDIGIALLPDIPIYSTAVPAKVMDYYTCAIPTLLTDNEKNRTLFNDKEALFCKFEDDAIVSKLEEIIDMSEEEIAEMGHSGQKSMLSKARNYEIMAKELFNKLESL